MGPGDLAQVLRHLPKLEDPRVLVGNNTADDAGVVVLNSETALVQTVDYFAPMVDDPFVFGQIAAANALSDIYAMGAVPITALNIVCFPVRKLPLQALADILRGGDAKAREAGVLVVGGHTVDDAEPKYGMAVTGLVHPDKIIRNCTPQPGDKIILTKPIGSGIITTALKSDKAGTSSVAEAIRVMSTLNREASEVLVDEGVHAMTDVTGFGLIGHLSEMLCDGTGGAGRIGARIWLSKIPVMPEVWELASRGIGPGGTRRNLSHFTSVRTYPGIPDEAPRILADPQTSGGLLAAVPAEKADTCLARLQALHPGWVSLIGEFTDEPGEAGIISVER